MIKRTTAKVKPWRSKAYLRLVAALPCYWCGLHGRSQAAHGPTLGARIKCGDDQTFPLCADGPGYVGCHGKFDRYEIFGREDRQTIADVWAGSVRHELRYQAEAMGIKIPEES